MPKSSRRKARILAFQIVYNRQKLGIQTEGEALHSSFSSLSDDHRQFSHDLVNTTWQNLERIDQTIQSHLINWKQSRISISLNALLRVCSGELLFFPDTDGKIVLNEAIEICKTFVDDSATGILNGVLHAIWQEMQNQKAGPSA
jgi:transcription antitermination protein NusB